MTTASFTYQETQQYIEVFFDFNHNSLQAYMLTYEKKHQEELARGSAPINAQISTMESSLRGFVAQTYS
jgi:hypothetical protein